MAFHSYKGGTGKTTCITNLAAHYANLGYKVCLIDFDIYAPSLTSYFEYTPNKYIHHLLTGETDINEVLVNYTPKLDIKGELHIAFSSPRKEDIHQIEINYDNKFQINALKKFLQIKKQLQEKNKFDYILIDTSPGIRFWSINALALADKLFFLLKINNMDINGTQKMIKEIYESLTRFGLSTHLILNKVPGASPTQEYEPEKFNQTMQEIENTLDTPISLTIPCYCDIQFNREEFLWVLKNPEHPFSKRIKEIPQLLTTLH